MNFLVPGKDMKYLSVTSQEAASAIYCLCVTVELVISKLSENKPTK